MAEIEKVRRIKWSTKAVSEFSKRSETAEKSGEATFNFEGQVFLTKYAHYLRGYLEEEGGAG